MSISHRCAGVKGDPTREQARDFQPQKSLRVCAFATQRYPPWPGSLSCYGPPTGRDRDILGWTGKAAYVTLHR
jgi:hypothetical protein